MYQSDFKVVVYTDLVSYNRMSGEFQSGQLTESQVLVEYPKGVTTKIRLCALAYSVRCFITNTIKTDYGYHQPK